MRAYLARLSHMLPAKSLLCLPWPQVVIIEGGAVPALHATCIADSQEVSCCAAVNVYQVLLPAHDAVPGGNDWNVVRASNGAFVGFANPNNATTTVPTWNQRYTAFIQTVRICIVQCDAASHAKRHCITFAPHDDVPYTADPQQLS